MADVLDEVLVSLEANLDFVVVRMDDITLDRAPTLLLADLCRLLIHHKHRDILFLDSAILVAHTQSEKANGCLCGLLGTVGSEALGDIELYGTSADDFVVVLWLEVLGLCDGLDLKLSDDFGDKLEEHSDVLIVELGAVGEGDSGTHFVLFLTVVLKDSAKKLHQFFLRTLRDTNRWYRSWLWSDPWWCSILNIHAGYYIFAAAMRPNPLVINDTYNGCCYRNDYRNTAHNSGFHPLL